MTRVISGRTLVFGWLRQVALPVAVALIVVARASADTSEDP